MPRRFEFLASVLVLGASGCSTLFPSGSGGPLPDATSTGCAASSTRHVAPGGYYVNGNTICTAQGQLHLFHGVDRPSLEWSVLGVSLSASDFQLMASWKANAVRIALNQDFWLVGSPYHDANYASRVDDAVHWAEEAGMDAILDLHWSDQGVLGSCSPTDGCQQRMADENSITFWSEVAARYRNDGRVLFELYNEPHDVSWDIWRSGGDTGAGWRAAGMQQLYDAVRAAGADNLVVIGGLDYAYDLSGVSSTRINGYNILYATHPYNNASEKNPGVWDTHWGFLTKTDPVIVTEFGDSSSACSSTYSSAVIAYADKHAASWTAWAWFPGGCTFPSLIDDWDGTPSAAGTVVKAALLGYSDPAPGGKRDAGGNPGDGAVDAGAGVDAVPGLDAPEAGTGTDMDAAGPEAPDAGTDADDDASDAIDDGVDPAGG